MYPYGNLNLGLAHGVPGILAALSLARLTGHRAERLEPAIRRIAESVVGYACGTPEIPTWPTVVPLRLDDGRLATSAECDQGRDAWCYGTPGAARPCTWRAPPSTSPPGGTWRCAAMAASTAGRSERAIDSPTFCHGVAGLLQITLRFAHDTGSGSSTEAAVDLTDQILGAVDPDRPMGIANLEPGDNPVDQPGLLDGASGVCLVLLSAATESNRHGTGSSDWHDRRRTARRRNGRRGLYRPAPWLVVRTPLLPVDGLGLAGSREERSRILS